MASFRLTRPSKHELERQRAERRAAKAEKMAARRAAARQAEHHVGHMSPVNPTVETVKMAETPC